MVSVGLTEGMALLLLVPLLQLVGLEVGKGGVGRIAELLASVFATVGLRPTLATVLGLYVLIFSVQRLLARWQATLALTLQQEFVASLRQRLYRAIARTRWAFFVRGRSSDFTHALTDELDRVGAATYYLFQLAATVLVALVYLLMATALSAIMTGVVVASGAGLMLALRGRTWAVQKAGEELSGAMRGFYAAITEHLAGMKTARSYGAEDRHAESFARLTEQVKHLQVHAVHGQTAAKWWFEVGSVILLSLLLYGAFQVLRLPTAEGFLLLYLFARLMPGFVGIQQSLGGLVHQMPAFQTVAALQAACETAAEPLAELAEPVELRERIRLEAVSFAYDGKPVLHDLNLTIPAGKTTALIGPSGAGKSTIADLVMGLLPPAGGQVLLDEVPLTPERMAAWRAQIGYVAQDTFLFHDTVRANLLWAHPEAADGDLWRALRLAAAEAFVRQLPHDLDTLVGDRGICLSGGERQRLALARALLRRPSLLILDEATAHLDTENEQRILEALDALRGRLTILVISYRPVLIGRADMIYLVEGGRVVEARSNEWALA
jgi:ATP-binding cassette subfamily C protein